MKSINLLLLALCLGTSIAAWPAETNFNEIAVSCSAVTVTGACSVLNIHPGDYVHIPSAQSFTWQTIISGGTASSVSVTLEGSIDGSTWVTLDTSTSTSGETRAKNTIAEKFFRCNVGTYSRNGTTLTCQIMPTDNASLADSPTALASGTSASLSAPREYYICTGTCTVTPPVPAAGYEFCVRNADNVATVITLAAIGSSARYENTANTAYGAAGTGTLVSGGATGDKVCIIGLDSTHYLTFSYAGSWTAN